MSETEVEEKLTPLERVSLKLIDAFETIQKASLLLAESKKKIAEAEKRADHYLKASEERGEANYTLRKEISDKTILIAAQKKTIEDQAGIIDELEAS